MIQNYIIGIDKVELTLKAKLPDYTGLTLDQLFEDNTPSHASLFNITQTCFNPNYIEGGFHLKHKAGFNTRNYNLVYSVWYNSKEVATLFLDNILNPDLINFKVANWLLYDSQQTETVVNEFLHTYQLQINNFSALDIYLDCRTNLIKLFDRYFYKPASYHFVGNKKQFSDKPENVFEYTQLNRSGDRNPTYYVGSSDKKQVCIYNKTKELQAVNKSYITALHGLCLKGIGDVFRFEVRLKNKYLIGKNHNLNFTQIFNSDFLRSFVSECLFKFVDFRKIDNDKVTRCTKIPLFDLTISDKKMEFQATNKVTQNSTFNTTKQDKTLIKQLINKAIQNKNRKYLNTAFDMAMECNLIDFYNTQIKGIDLNKVKPAKKIEVLTDINFDEF